MAKEKKRKKKEKKGIKDYQCEVTFRWLPPPLIYIYILYIVS